MTLKINAISQRPGSAKAALMGIFN